MSLTRPPAHWEAPLLFSSTCEAPVTAPWFCHILSPVVRDTWGRHGVNTRQTGLCRGLRWGLHLSLTPPGYVVTLPGPSAVGTVGAPLLVVQVPVPSGVAPFRGMSSPNVSFHQHNCWPSEHSREIISSLWFQPSQGDRRGQTDLQKNPK